MKIYAPIIFKYSSVVGCPEDDMYSEAQVLDIDIIHNHTVVEEEKMDKKEVAETIKKKSHEKNKDYIKKTEMLKKKYQFVVDYSSQLGLDLSGLKIKILFLIIL